MDTWSHVYEFSENDAKFVAVRGNKDVQRRFRSPPNDHDGFWIDYCINRRERELLRFMVSIFGPDKPMTCTIKLTGAILESYSGKLRKGEERA